jgi:single-stranded DNA-binding protein
MNNLTVVGNTCKIVTYREKDKTQLATFPIAVNYKYKNEKRAYFLDCVIFGPVAKIIADFKLEVGTLMFLSGELHVEEWTNEEGRVFKNLKLMVNSFNIIKRGGTTTGQQTPQQEQQQQSINLEGSENDGFKTIKSGDFPF